MRESTARPGDPDGELVAIQALGFLAGRPEELSRFLALSGIDPADMRQLAGDTMFLGGVLDFLLEDEALLLVFAAEAGFAPEAITSARRRLDTARQPLDSGEN